MKQKVLVALITGEHIRRADFLPSFIGLLRPEGSVTATSHGQSPASNRNNIIKQALEHNCSHIFFLDDDMVPPPDTLIKLLRHDKDIVTALYLSRAFPHRPVFFDKALPNGYCKYYGFTGGETGLIKGVNCGLGAVLISIEVFKKVTPPWIRLGEIEKDGWCDDIGFFNRCREAGFDIYCDLDAPVGHLSQMLINPEIHDGKWMTNYKQPNGNVLIAQQVLTKSEVDADEARALALTP